LEQSSNARFTTEVEQAEWDANAQTKISFNSSAEKVYRGAAPETQEDITTAFRYVAGTPYMKDIVNDGPPRAEGEPADPYLNLRDIFTLHNVTVDHYEENTLGDDADYFAYTAVVNLKNYLYNGSNLNNCIYLEECRQIEQYTALVALDQVSADMLSINKITRTSYNNEYSSVQFNTTFPSGVVNINSILFIRKDRNVLPVSEGYTAVDFLQSSGSPYIDTGIASTYNCQLGVVFTALSGTDDKVIIGNGDYLGAKYNSTDDCWNWVFKYNGTENVYTTSAVDVSNYYHIEIVDDGTYKRVFINGAQIFKVSTGSSNTNNIYLFANNNSGTAEKFATMKLYNLKIFSGSTKLLLGDYALCTLSNVAKMYNLVNKVVLGQSGSGTISGGYEPNIKDFIIKGARIPTNTTRGNVNQFYRVTGTNNYYVCLGYSSTSGYIWKESLLSYIYEN